VAYVSFCFIKPDSAIMTGPAITALSQRFASVKVGVIGDFALDLYFDIQTRTGEYSLETGREVFWGSQPRASLGAAGNVVQNLHALGVVHCWAIGCVGDDLFGREMVHLFRSLGVNTQHMLLAEQWTTCLYAKPNRQRQELNRIDFGTANSLTDPLFANLLAGLEQCLSELDVLIINQQFSSPLLTANRVAVLNALIARFPRVRVVADMRTVGMHIRGATLKVNTAELAHFLGIDLPESPDLDWCVEQGVTFQRQTNVPLLITRGQAGILYMDEAGTESIDGLSLQGELDTVGAGDTVVATWATCMGAGATPEQGLKMANLAAGVTVQKLGQTGTATLTEILTLHDEHQFHA
jgi:rfaE bifunctional protein kinase chain/domain